MSKSPMDRLTDETRIKGQTRMFADDKKPEAVTTEEAQDVIANVLAYISATGITRTAIAKSIGVAASTFGSVLNGNYAGQSAQILIDADRWLEEQTKRDNAPKPSTFCWTKVAQEIRTVAEMASHLRGIGLVYGPTTSGIGKTMALQAINDTKPGSILVTVEQPGNTRYGLLRSICRAMRRSDSGSQEKLYEVVKQTLSGSTRLLMIDEIHLLCGVRDNDPLFMLKSLFDATGAPQLWCGTADLVTYLDQQQAKGKPAMAQIRRRISISRDLLQRTDSQGGDGDPLYSVEEIRAIYSKNKMRLAPDAARYLCELANLPDSGALGTCTNLVRMATKINEDNGGAITAQMLREVHRLLVNNRAFTLMETRLAATKPGPMLKVG